MYFLRGIRTQARTDYLLRQEVHLSVVDLLVPLLRRLVLDDEAFVESQDILGEGVIGDALQHFCGRG